MSKRRRPTEPRLNAEEIRSRFDYDPVTGVLYWSNKARKHIAGKPVGRLRGGYLTVEMKFRTYQVHRIIWMWVHGEWPLMIDHINHNRQDNRLSNLRNVDHFQSNQNRASHRGSSKFIGVTADPRGGWRASITHMRKRVQLGRFDSEIEAHEAYMKAKAEMHTYWANEVKGGQVK